MGRRAGRKMGAWSDRSPPEDSAAMKTAAFLFASLLVAACGPSTNLPRRFDGDGGGDPTDAAREPVDFTWNGPEKDLAHELPVLDLFVCEDRDHDGVNTCAGDCDDLDPRAHPGAAEI